MYVDIIVIIPLEIEFKEFQKCFVLGRNVTSGSLLAYEFEHAGITGLAILQDDMGYWGATSAANSITGNYNTSLVVCGGIAGNLSSDMSIGDVCYSGTIIDTVTNGKIEDTNNGDESVELSPDFFPTPKHLHGSLTFFRVMPEFSEAYEQWQELCHENEEAEKIAAKLEGWEARHPDSHQGDIACGLVSKSSSYKAKLKKVNRKVLAIETESGAIARFCDDNGYEFLAVRGVCDNADSDKNRLEDRTKDVPRKVAAFNAFSFLAYQIEYNSFFREYLSTGRPTTSNFEQQEPAEIFSNALAIEQERLLAETVAQLRATNQSFRTLPDGAVLPMPRFKVHPSRSSSDQQTSSPVEIKEATAANSKLFTIIPRVFPDKSLPWLIAHSLHYEQKDDRQFLPIVLSGYDIRKPSGTLAHLCGFDVQQVIAAGGLPVFIIDDFPLGSKTRTKFLAEQMRAYPDCHFIILSHDTPDIKDANSFVLECGAEQADITDTSFSEITNFLAGHFSLATEQAQVVALRLTTVFQKFGLQVHPTFFAGIPQELIASLLDANRRGELIQLAVDGYLTHVVAGDDEVGRLSRTTRAEFLRQYVRLIKIERRPLTVQEIREITADEFERRRYPNDPELFVERFLDTNVLIEVNGKVDFGLNFIESYFTALEVGTSAEIASQYFCVEVDNFDYRSFDLYCEICAHESYIEQLIKLLEDLEIMSIKRADKSPLCTGEIHPNLLRRKGMTGAVRKRVEVATKAVRDGRDATKEKQRFLDVADRVYEQTVERRDDSGLEQEPTDHIDEALTIWSLSVVMLGQGSEALSGDQKDRLTLALVRSSAFLLEDWTVFNSKADFEKLKTTLTSPKELASIIDPSLELPSKLTAEELVAAFVDIMEMSYVSEPTRIVLTHLADEARHRVILPSLKSVEAKGFVSQLIKATWLSEIDTKEAKPYLAEMVKDFPDSIFLRSLISTHYSFRTYWAMSKRQSRLQLLSVANDILKPLGKELPIREIEQHLKKQKDLE